MEHLLNNNMGRYAIYLKVDTNGQLSTRQEDKRNTSLLETLILYVFIFQRNTLNIEV